MGWLVEEASGLKGKRVEELSGRGGGWRRAAVAEEEEASERSKRGHGGMDHKPLPAYHSMPYKQ